MVTRRRTRPQPTLRRGIDNDRPGGLKTASAMSSLVPPTFPQGSMLGRYRIEQAARPRRAWGRSTRPGTPTSTSASRSRPCLPALASRPELRARFLREGQATARLRHPHAVDVSDVGVEGRDPLPRDGVPRRRDARGACRARGAVVRCPRRGAHAAQSSRPEGCARRGHRAPRPQAGEHLPPPDRATTARPCPRCSTSASRRWPGMTAHRLSRRQRRSSARHTTCLPSSSGARSTSTRVATSTRSGPFFTSAPRGQKPFQGETMFLLMNAIVNGHFMRPARARPLHPRWSSNGSCVRAMSLDPSQRFESLRALGCSLLAFAEPRVRDQWESVFDSAARDCLGPELADAALHAPTHPASLAGARNSVLPTPPPGTFAGAAVHLASTPAPSPPRRVAPIVAGLTMLAAVAGLTVAAAQRFVPVAPAGLRRSATLLRGSPSRASPGTGATGRCGAACVDRDVASPCRPPPRPSHPLRQWSRRRAK
jgi:hypothetical protein